MTEVYERARIGRSAVEVPASVPLLEAPARAMVVKLPLPLGQVLDCLVHELERETTDLSGAKRALRGGARKDVICALVLAARLDRSWLRNRMAEYAIAHASDVFAPPRAARRTRVFRVAEPGPRPLSSEPERWRRRERINADTALHAAPQIATAFVVPAPISERLDLLNDFLTASRRDRHGRRLRVRTSSRQEIIAALVHAAATTPDFDVVAAVTRYRRATAGRAIPTSRQVSGIITCRGGSPGPRPL